MIEISINRYQSIKLVNWYRLVYRSIDDQSITTQKPFIDCYRFMIGTATSNRRHARYLYDQTNPAQSSQRKEYTLFHVYSNYHLPVIVFPCHYVDARSPGRGSTEYKVYRQRLSLCRFEVNIGEVFTASKKRGEHGNEFKVVNHRGQLGHLQSELVGTLWPLHANASQDHGGSGSEQTTESSRKTPKLEWPIVYYYDEKRGTSFLSFAAYLIPFRQNWRLHRFFSLYVCNLCFKQD